MELFNPVSDMCLSCAGLLCHTVEVTIVLSLLSKYKMVVEKLININKSSKTFQAAAGYHG
jgi:hypothetical protein